MVIGAPLDLGQGRRGVDMGPSAIRAADLNARLRSLGYEVEDAGNVAVAIPEMQPYGNRRAKYLKEVAETCKRVARQVTAVMRRGFAPLVLGGDHSIAVGTVAGVSKFFQKRGKRIGLIWIDAHADMNTPQTSPSGNIHGMPLACCVGLGPRELTNIEGYAPLVRPENVALVGVRDVDVLEKPHVRHSGVRAFTMRHIDERGLRTVMEEAIQIASEDTAGFHVSLDMDFIDPTDAPGVGTPIRGGGTYREAHLAMEMLSDAGRMTSMEVVEVNPILDEENRTARLAVELAMSALGKRIL
ncbi:MAG: arginase [Acidobacteria bacterium]|nr:arginase [Acidobacteriota bacterium]